MFRSKSSTQFDNQFSHECPFKRKYGQWNSIYFGSDATLHPSDSDLAIQFVDWCKWLVYVASLLAPKSHLLLFFVLIGLDIVKTLPRCYLQTYFEELVFSCKKKYRQQQHPIPFDAVAMKATASFIREKITQDQLFLHVQVEIKHIIRQTFFAWMSFQTWIRTMEFSYV